MNRWRLGRKHHRAKECCRWLMMGWWEAGKGQDGPVRWGRSYLFFISLSISSFSPKALELMEWKHRGRKKVRNGK